MVGSRCTGSEWALGRALEGCSRRMGRGTPAAPGTHNGHLKELSPPPLRPTPLHPLPPPPPTTPLLPHPHPYPHPPPPRTAASRSVSLWLRAQVERAALRLQPGTGQRGRMSSRTSKFDGIRSLDRVDFDSLLFCSVRFDSFGFDSQRTASLELVRPTGAMQGPREPARRSGWLEVRAPAGRRVPASFGRATVAAPVAKQPTTGGEH